MLSKSDETRTDPRVKRTRELLRNALLELMAEKPFQGITVQDIAERATVNRVTFYAHFNDKYTLLEFAIREDIRQRLANQIPAEAPFTPENLERLIQTVCEYVAETARHCPPPHGQLEPLMEKQIKAEVYEVLHGWLVQTPGNTSRRRSKIPARGRPESRELAATIASWAIYGAAVQWGKQENGGSARDFARQVLPLIQASLASAVVERP